MASLVLPLDTRTSYSILSVEELWGRTVATMEVEARTRILDGGV